MFKRKSILLLTVAVLAVLLIFGGLFFWIQAKNNPIGKPNLVVQSTPNPPVPTILATPQPTDSGATGNTGSPTPTSPPVIQGNIPTPPAGQELNLPPPPSMKDLLAKYPQLADLMKNLNLNDQDQLQKVYDQMLVLYQNEGLSGVHTFLSQSGIMQALNIDSAYLDFIVAYEKGGADAAEKLARQRGMLTPQNELRVVLILDTEDVSLIQPQLDQVGARINKQYKNKVEIGIPLATLLAMGSSGKSLSALVTLAHAPHVIGFQMPQPTPSSDLPASGEGPKVTGADRWHAAGFTGAGIKIGLIDPDGFHNFLKMVGTDLPSHDHLHFPDGTNENDLNNNTGDHGAACAEILHAMAPGADLYLYYSGGDELGFEKAVDWMIASKVNVISYSANSSTGPLDGTGYDVSVAQRAIDKGIVWVNSAGNNAQGHILQTFTDKDNDGWHEFADNVELLQIYPAHDQTNIGLTWDDKWGGASEDYDLYVYTDAASGSGYDEVVSSRDSQGGGSTDYPRELVIIPYDSSKKYYVAVQASKITHPGRLNLIGWHVDFSFSMAKGSIGTPADGANVLTVGAVNWQDFSLPDYSSEGPTWDGRIKPDISAPTNVSSVTYDKFTGTSASCPHVAGAAALVLQAFPNATPDQVKDYLFKNSVDMGDPGEDNIYGYGRLQMPVPPSSPAPLPVNPNTQVSIQKIWQEHNIYISDIKGMNIHVSFNINNLQGQSVTVSALFSNQTTNQPLKDQNNNFVSPNGQVAVSKRYTPVNASETVSDYVLFMPYDELDLPSGDYKLDFEISITKVADNSELVRSQPTLFDFSQASDTQAKAHISDIEVDKDQEQNGEPGLTLYLTFEVLHHKDQQGEIAVYFYFDDNSNRPLKDYNNLYRTANGDVAVGQSFTPSTDDTTYSRLPIFMPYSELHLQAGQSYNLKFYVSIWNKDKGNEIAVSDWVPFTYSP